MNHALIINGHYPYPTRKGLLNGTLAKMACEILQRRGVEAQITETADDWDVEAEVEKFKDADLIIWQYPVHWMGLPWRVKQYIDEVLTAGAGSLFGSDGRTSENPMGDYGTGGMSQRKKYMLSLTFNAPLRAFNAPGSYLLDGRSVDDLMCPVHMTMRFLGMQQLPTFACHDVVKNPDVESDFVRFRTAIEALVGDEVPA